MKRRLNPRFYSSNNAREQFFKKLASIKLGELIDPNAFEEMRRKALGRKNVGVRKRKSKRKQNHDRR